MADTEWAFPFADNNGDRVYSDSDFAKFFSAWFVNGVFINVGGGLQLVDSVAGGMRITLNSGAANINGRVYYLNTNTDLTVPVASSVQDRTDSIVVKLDLTNRVMGVVYKQGDTSVVRNSNVYELQIATIFVAKNISEITVDMITDMRTNKTVCGLASPNDPIDVDQFITQFKALFDKQLTDNGNAFTEWFENLKNELDSNQAANLQNQINNNNTKIDSNTSNINLLLAKTTVSAWAANKNYSVGDLVTFQSLGSTSTGLLTNPIFMCLTNHTSSNVFPDSSNTQWQLINVESYNIQQDISTYPLTVHFIRVGYRVSLILDAIVNSINESPYSVTTGVNSPFRPARSYVIVANNAGSFEVRPNGSLISWSKQNVKGEFGGGDYSVTNAPVWVAGTPTQA